MRRRQTGNVHGIRFKTPTSSLPHGSPCTKNTTESKFTTETKFATATAKRYGEVSEVLVFLGKAVSELLQIGKPWR